MRISLPFWFLFEIPANNLHSVLAELMLPDGAHKSVQDWTVFFLNQPLPEAVRVRKAAQEAEARAKAAAAASTLHAEAAATVSEAENAIALAVGTLEGYVYLYTESSQAWEMIGTAKQTVTLGQNSISFSGTDKILYARSMMM